MSTLYLHIGMPKTGTTAIQGFFETNQEVLKQYGISYPLMEQNETGEYKNAHFLSPRDYKRGLYKHNWSIVESELKKYEKVLLSDETLFRTGGDVDEFWKIILKRIEKAGADLKVIIYLRRQDDFFLSYYFQNVRKRSRVLSLRESVLREWMYMPQWNYYKYVQRIASVIGKENIIIRVYEKDQLKGGRGSTVDDILEILGIGPDKYKDLDFELKMYNPSIRDLTVAAKRYYNQVFEEHRTKLECHKITWVLNTADQKLSERGMIKKRTGMTKDIRQKVLNKYKNSNKKLAREYFGKDELFFDKIIDKGDTEAVFSRDELEYTYNLWVDEIENYPDYGYSREQMRELCNEALKLYDRDEQSRPDYIRYFIEYFLRVKNIMSKRKKHIRKLKKYKK